MKKTLFFLLILTFSFAAKADPRWFDREQTRDMSYRFYELASSVYAELRGGVNYGGGYSNYGGYYGYHQGGSGSGHTHYSGHYSPYHAAQPRGYHVGGPYGHHHGGYGGYYGYGPYGSGVTSAAGQARELYFASKSLVDGLDKEESFNHLLGAIHRVRRAFQQFDIAMRNHRVNANRQARMLYQYIRDAQFRLVSQFVDPDRK